MMYLMRFCENVGMTRSMAKGREKEGDEVKERKQEAN